MSIAIKKSLGDYVFDTFNYIFLFFVAVFSLYPFLYVLFASVSIPQRLIQHDGLLLLPLGFQIDGYLQVFKNTIITIGYKNTLIYVIAGTAINVLLTVIGAYVLSRKWFSLKNIFMLFITVTMFVNGGLIPSYLLVRELGIFNTRWAILFPGAISTWNLIITRTYFSSSIPDSMEESAKIDGANDYIVLFKIMLPLAVPIVAVITLFYAVGHWNSWFNALIYLNDRNLYPLQLFLREILVSASADTLMIEITSERDSVREVIKYATIIISTLPILCIYPFAQKYFIKGIMVGALKG